MCIYKYIYRYVQTQLDIQMCVHTRVRAHTQFLFMYVSNTLLSLHFNARSFLRWYCCTLRGLPIAKRLMRFSQCDKAEFYPLLKERIKIKNTLAFDCLLRLIIPHFLWFFFLLLFCFLFPSVFLFLSFFLIKMLIVVVRSEKSNHLTYVRI